MCSYEVSSGLYDVDYLEALFDGNEQEIAQIEKSAQSNGFGPLTSCTTVWNYSTIKVQCREWFLCVE